MRRSKEVHTVLLTASVGALLGGCEGAPSQAVHSPQGVGSQRPVLMTSANRPSYANRQRCETDFGEEKCRRDSGYGGHYRPIYTPGQTYYVPGRGYYNGEVRSARSVRSTSWRPTDVGRPSAVSSSSGGASRGGFGSTGQTSSSGRGITVSGGRGISGGS